MFTCYEFVIVKEVKIFELSKSGRKWRTQSLLFTATKRSRQVFHVQIRQSIDISDIRKGDKVQLQLEIYRRGKSEIPQFCVIGVEKYE